MEPAVVYLTHQVHHQVQYAGTDIAGPGEAIIRYIPVDEHFRTDTKRLHQQLEMDRFAGLGAVHGRWLGRNDRHRRGRPVGRDRQPGGAVRCGSHVDAAYGVFLLADELKGRFRASYRSDSLAIDLIRLFRLLLTWGQY